MMLHRQGGMTLIMGMIMLVVLTLLALTSFTLGKSNMVIVSNMQQRDQSIAAARELLEEVISNGKFHETPEYAVLNPCKGDNTRCLDIDGDKVNDITVALATPMCVKAQVIRIDELDADAEADRDCLTVPDASAWGTARPPGQSLCANSTWELNVTATDDLTAAAVTVTQGVAARVDSNEVAENCPI